MNSIAEQLRQLDDAQLDQSARALLRCQFSKQLEDEGDYEGARAALGPLWQRVGERPRLEGLNERAAAEVLLRVAALTGWLGRARQIVGAQERAKDLVGESAARFESLGDAEKIAEAQLELARCYWREGALDEARLVLRDLLARLADKRNEQKAAALLLSAVVENSATRFNDSLRLLLEAAPLFAATDNHILKGRFHNELATTLKDLGAAEQREDYTDRALVEYAAASFHFEQAGHERYLAYVENNLGYLFLTLGRFAEAQEHLDRAARLFQSLKDRGSAAQVDETRARALLAQERYREAEEIAREAARVLEEGDEQSLLS